MIEVVIKIGGRLGRGNKLEPFCKRLAELGRKHRILVLPGGGAFAEMVREYDRRYRLGNSTSHWMAILAMDQFGYLLADLIPDSEPVRGLMAARKVSAAGRIPVLLSFDLLWRADPLEHSWTVTSDSIGVWVAELAGAQMLVLLKDVDGLYTTDPRGERHAELLEKIRLDQLAVCQGIDPCMARLLSANTLKLWIINGEKPNRLAELLEKGHTKGTHVQRVVSSGVALSGDPPDH